jgi:hypothetical protein
MSLRLDRPGRTLRFDPRAPPAADDVVALTWAWPEHVDGTAAAAAAGARPTVVAPSAVLQWIAARGDVDGGAAQLQVDGMHIEQEPYAPIPWATPSEAVFKAASALRRPDRALRRLALRRGRPSAPPVVTRVTFPDGEQLVHLNLSLHAGTEAPWADALSGRWGGARWLIVGVDHGHDDAVLRHLPAFQARHIILTDLLSETRRALGLPTRLLTPLRDRAVAQGLDAYVLVSGAALRFE